MEEAWAAEYTYIGIIVDVASIQKLQVCDKYCESEVDHLMLGNSWSSQLRTSSGR